MMESSTSQILFAAFLLAAQAVVTYRAVRYLRTREQRRRTAEAKV